MIINENLNHLIGVTWGVLGAAEACYEIARDYVIERKQFDIPLSQNQIIQQKLTDMCTEITLGLHATYRLSKLIDQGEYLSNEAYMLKRNNTRKALEIARQARDMLGSNGTLDEYGVIRHMLNLESANTYGGTYDYPYCVVGEAITD